MTTPYSLRLCCLVTMAPALTDPSSKSFSKLPTKLHPPDKIQLGTTQIQDKTVDWNSKLTESKYFKELGFKEQGILQRALAKSFGNSIKSDIPNITDSSLVQTLQKNRIALSYKKENITEGCFENMNQHSESLNGYQENGKQDVESVNNIKLASLKECKATNDEKRVEDFQSAKITETESNDTEMVASDNNIETIDVVGSSDVEMAREVELEVAVKTEEELSSEVSKKQHMLERRNQHLLRRLRRMQARQLEMHCRNQVGSFVSFQRKNLQTVANKSIGTQNLIGTQSELKAELLKSEDVRNLSTTALVNLVRKIQANHASMNRRLTTQIKSKDEKEYLHLTSVLNMDSEVSAESGRVGGHLSSNMHHMLKAFDSDATESSSGGESCDEYDDYEQERKEPPPLHRRAEWKWSTDRAAVASRWTWLQAQVSDLEYRIRQQSEIFKQIRHAKGSVVLGDPPSLEEIGARLRQARASGQKLSPFETKIADIDLKSETNGSPCNISTLLLNVNQQATKLTQSLGNCLTPVQSASLEKPRTNTTNAKSLNGVISSHTTSSDTTSIQTSSGIIPGPSGDNAPLQSPESSSVFPFLDATCMAARCRPVRSYRKRKLLLTAGLHQVNRKAARLSTIKCHCNPPTSSCPMCGGRYNNSQGLDPLVMSLPEKVAALDPAFHPVLSFKGEIPLPIHFESLLKSGDWQNKPPPKTAKVLAAEKRRQKLLSNSMRDRVRKNPKYGKHTANALIASAKLRNKYERTPPKSLSLKSPKKKVSDGSLCRPDLKRRRDAAKFAHRHAHGDDNLLLSLTDSLTSGSRTPTPSPQMKDGLLSSSCSSAALKELRRRREDAYDIDNIVIPYSMAASTRVEKLQYKEIVTPKWREVSDTKTQEGNNTTTDKEKTVQTTYVPVVEGKEEEEEECEDISEEAFIERHKICEAQEKKRFTSFIQYPSRRSRGSRNEAGPNTPDIPVENNTVKDESIPPPLAEDAGRKRSSTVSTASVQTFTFPATPTSDESFRRRSSSTSVRRISNVMEENIDFEYDPVEPWPERKFPLTEAEYEEMKKVLPPIEVKDNRTVRSYRVSSSAVSLNELAAEYIEDNVSVSSRTSSPVASLSSGSNGIEDPDDPEWTAAKGEAARAGHKSRR